MIKLDTKCFHHDKNSKCKFHDLNEFPSEGNACHKQNMQSCCNVGSKYVLSEVDSIWISVVVLQKPSHSGMIYIIFPTWILAYPELQQTSLPSPFFACVNTSIFRRKIWLKYLITFLFQKLKKKNPSSENQLGIKMDSESGV